MALVARTRSGKTTAARSILMLRDWVVVLGTKPRDEGLYGGFEAQGYVVREKWSPRDLRENRVIFRPPFDPENLGSQREPIRAMLMELFRTGGWTLYLDEARYVSRDLRLEQQLDLLWLQGGALGVTIVAGTQRPVSVPRNMFEQSSWFCFWRVPDLEDRQRAAEMLGPMRGVAVETMAQLPRYEFLLADTIEDYMVRTRVPAPGA